MKKYLKPEAIIIEIEVEEIMLISSDLNIDFFED